MKKALNITKAVLTWLLIVAAVAMMIFTVVSVSLFDKNDRDLFGFKAYIILSDSMSAVNGDTSKGYFKAGDLVIVKEVDPSTLKEGDIVSYISTNTENHGKTVTHMIRAKTTDDMGNPGFITYGTTTGTDDANIVTYPYVMGKYDGIKLPSVGYFFQFLKTPPGYIICIFLPFLLLIGIQGFNSIRLFKKYKREELEAIESERQAEREQLEAERAAIAEERARQEEMMQQLLQMKEELKKSSGSSNTESKPEIKEDEGSSNQ